MRHYTFDRTRYADPGTLVVMAEMAGHRPSAERMAEECLVVPVDEARRDPALAEAVHEREIGDDAALEGRRGRRRFGSANSASLWATPSGTPVPRSESQVAGPTARRDLIAEAGAGGRSTRSRAGSTRSTAHQ